MSRDGFAAIEREEQQAQDAQFEMKFRKLNACHCTICNGKTPAVDGFLDAKEMKIEEQIEESIALSIPPRTIARNAYALGYRAGQEVMRERAAKEMRTPSWAAFIRTLPIEEAK